MKRIIAMVIFAGIALVASLYALVQKGIADKNLRIAYELRLKWEACAKEASMQRQMAEQAAMRAAEAQRQAEEELKKYRK